MNLAKKPQNRERCTTPNEEENENRFVRSHGAVVQTTADGKYQCRYCRLVFDTLEAHDAHHRQVHGQYSEYLTVENQS
jgi:aspartate carbamoyltransferase regulatory subunit